MFLQMDFDTENTALSGIELEIKNACLRLISVYYEISSGFHINLGVFSSRKAMRPIVNIQYNVGQDSEYYKKHFIDEVVSGKSFIETVYGYLLSIPEFQKAKIVKDG